MTTSSGGLSERKVAYKTPPISRISMGRTPFSDRKLSFPTSLHASLLGLPTSTNGENRKEATNAKRRFSNVGDVVSRKLSNTITGWTSPNVPPENVILQGRVLCSQYIKYRLKRSGIFNKKMRLYRYPSNFDGATVRDISPFLMAAGMELERMYPKLYACVSRQATISPGGVLVSDKTAAGLLVAIGHELLKSDVTWGKVVSIFAVAGGLAVDCVCQGHPEYLHGLMRGMTEILEDDLAVWVAANGGWSTLCNQCKCPKADLSWWENNIFVVGLIIVILLLYLVVRLTEKLGYF